MAILKDILFGVDLQAMQGSRDVEISAISRDLTGVAKGCLFATKAVSDIGQAVKAGAVAILCEEFPKKTSDKVTYIKTSDVQRAYGICAANYFDRPSEKLQLVGVAGSYGKSSIIHLTKNLFDQLGYNAVILPKVADAMMLNRYLAEQVSQGATHALLEMDLALIHQRCVSGLEFSGAVFTNISNQKEEFKGSFEQYIRDIKSFFDELSADTVALINADDRRAGMMTQNTRARVLSFGIKSMADYKAKVLHHSFEGVELDLDGAQSWFRLVGQANVYNLLAVFSLAIAMGEEREEVIRALSTLAAVEGSFQRIPNARRTSVIIDFADNRDALKRALSSLNDLRTRNEKLVNVIGCKGEENAQMAVVASSNGNKTILTSPLMENAANTEHLNAMKEAVPVSKRRRVMVIQDREEALRTACHLVESGDVLFVNSQREAYQKDTKTLTEMLN